jgi:hypothetical protein
MKHIWLSAFFAGLGLGFIISHFLVLYYLSETPKALDVYRGKTTLQITYKDTIPVDTTVVFK